MSGSAWYPVLPLAIALAALGAREATRALPRDPQRVHASSEFLAPDLALLGARAPVTDQELAVDAVTSRAVLSGVGPLRVRAGTVSARAEDAGWTVELALELPDALDSGGELQLRLRTREVRTSSVPGCRTASMRGTWAADSLGGDLQIDASWMRMPGGTARLQGVTQIENLKLGSASTADGNDDQPALALELQLVPRGTRK